MRSGARTRGDARVGLRCGRRDALAATDVYAPVRDALARFGQDDLLNRQLYADLSLYLADDILVKVDRASMAVSLETRIPLLDPEVVAFGLGLPVDLRMRNGVGKQILRETLKRYVPEQMFTRPKTGFTPPVESWLLGPLRGWAEDLLSQEALSRHGLLNAQSVRRFWEYYKRGGAGDDARIWAVLQLQSWMAARSL